MLLVVLAAAVGTRAALAERLDARLGGIEHASERGERELRDELSRVRQEHAQQGSALRTELGDALASQSARRSAASSPTWPA